MKKQRKTISPYSAIYRVIRRIPFGKVATYGQIADLAGVPKRSRLVGYSLKRPNSGNDLPWHRVVNASGSVSYSPSRNLSDHRQRMLLEAEGILFNERGKLDLAKHRWKPR